MTRALRSGAMAAAMAGLAAVVAVLVGVDRRDLVVDALLLTIAGVAALSLGRVAAAAFPRPRRLIERAVAVRTLPRARPDSLARMEDAVALARSSALDFHFGLRTILREIAAAGLSSRAGLDLEAVPEQAEAMLSPATWGFVRPDRPRPEPSEKRGVDAGTLKAVVEELERLFSQ